MAYDCKEKKQAWDRRRREDTRLRLEEYLRSHPCVDCGNSDLRVLEFDHVKGVKLFNVKDFGTQKFESLLPEIEKCEVRCANCHKIRHYEDNMKAPAFGPQDGAKFNVAVQRPTVNIKEAENVGEQAAAAARVTPRPSFSKHATFGPRAVTHPGLENL